MRDMFDPKIGVCLHMFSSISSSMALTLGWSVLEHDTHHTQKICTSK